MYLRLSHETKTDLNCLKTAPKLRLPSHLSAKDVNSLEDKGVLSLPPESILYELLARFIDYVHPQLPFLDLAQFRGDVRAKVFSGNFSLFVFHALLATTFPHTDEKVLQALGFDNARDASQCYRIKALVSKLEPGVLNS